MSRPSELFRLPVPFGDVALLPLGSGEGGFRFTLKCLSSFFSLSPSLPLAHCITVLSFSLSLSLPLPAPPLFLYNNKNVLPL